MKPEIAAHALGCVFAIEATMTAIYLMLGNDLLMAVLTGVGAIATLELATYARRLGEER